MTDRWDEIERIGRRPQPSDPFFAEYVQAAARACLFELKVRLYADNTPELRRHLKADLEPLVRRVAEHAAELLSEDEIAHLKKCARARNRLLHANFSEAVGALLSFGVEIDRGKVHLVDLESGETKKVSQMSTADGRIFGWIAEGATNGTFRQAGALFMRGVALINWMLTKASEVPGEGT